MKIQLIKEFFYRIYKAICWIAYLRFPIGKKVFVIGLPNHYNIGDSAIALAEISFLEKLFNKNRIKSISVFDYYDYKSIIKKYILKKELICGLGGGNMGNIWYEEEELFRYDFMETFFQNPIIIFPQSVFFTSDSKGEKAFQFSKKYYNKANLTIVARDSESFDFVNSAYEKPNKLLVPDIVLSMRMEDFGVSVSERKGVLFVFRDDSEGVLSSKTKMDLINHFENIMPYSITDMFWSERITNSIRREVVRKKMQEFADSQIVITDRLHGMIFSAITGTPCIVLGNSYFKIKSGYKWVSNLEYIKYANNVDEVFAYSRELLMKEQRFAFNNNHLLSYYNDLADEVKQYVN